MSESNQHQTHGDIIFLAPNGYRLPEEYHPEQTVATALKHAVKELIDKHQLDPNVSADAYVLVLGDTSLDSSMTLAQSGVHIGDVLKIRTKKIPSDGDAS